MGMGEDDRIDLGGLKAKALVTQPIHRIAALMHAAVQQHLAHRRRTQQVTGPGYLLRRT